MGISRELSKRCQDKCELCGAESELSAMIVTPKSGDHLDHIIATCSMCYDQIENAEDLDTNHWRCLNDSMWHPEPAVQVMSYRLLHRLKAADWARNLLEMMYLDEDNLAWAKSGIKDSAEAVIHKDSNGVILEAGDSVVLIKDLKVKGSSMVAKRGTAVRRIRLVPDNANHIEGKVDGQTIVILTEFVKK